MQIFMDMDIVLADFLDGIERLLERKITWIRGSLNKSTGMTDEELFALVNTTSGFWSNLKVFPWTTELLRICDYVVTYPQCSEHCYSEKRNWLRRLSNKPLIYCEQKWLLAKENRLLIDDNLVNILGWRREGGKGILFPSVLTGTECYDPLEYIMTQLSIL